MATLVSVNVGLPKNVAWNGRTVYTGVWKQPVAGPRMVRRLNVDGDGQGDLGGHGGENRAVLVYQLDSYRYWSDELRRDDLRPGHFGENFTVEGLPDDEVCIGDRYRIGQAVFEVTQPRVTCYRVGLRLGEPQMAALLVSHRRPGFYFRVITEGQIEAGQDIVKIGSGPEQVSVAEIDALLYLPFHPRDALERALRIPALSAGWKGSLQNLLTQADGTSTSAGNTGLTAAAGSPPPAWAGFRRLQVTATHDESRTVRSITLADPDGAPLPSWRPGQSIAVRLSREGTQDTLIRNYSLSNWVGAGNYRISVKRETHGIASTYIHSHVKVGDILEVAAPRGVFFLTEAESPVILMSAGVGVTPVLSMLHTLAAIDSPRQVWWLHAARDQSQQPFALESQASLDQLSNGHRRVFYSRPEPPDQLPAGAERGRLSAAADRRTRASSHLRSLSLRAEKLHGRRQCGTHGAGLHLHADSHRNIWRHNRTHTRYRRGGGPAASTGRSTRVRAAGAVRPQRHNGAIWPARRQPARIRRSLRRSGAVVMPHRCMPQLRDAADIWNRQLHPRTSGTTSAGQHPAVLHTTRRTRRH